MLSRNCALTLPPAGIGSLKRIVKLEFKLPPFVDVADKLEQLAAATGIPTLTNWAEQFNELRAKLRFNVNRQLATEALLLLLCPPPGSKFNTPSL